MKRKSVYCLLVVLSIGLVACGSKSLTVEWLVGTWYSDEWQVTYDISLSNGQWMIKNKENVIVKNATIAKSSTGKKIVLVSPEGTKYVITKIDDQTINYYQTAKTGLIGTTKIVTLKKKN